MKAAVFTLIFGVLAAADVGAQSIAVVSGEHDGFTRLTVAIPANEEWSIKQTDAGYELILERPDARFDLTRAFDRIQRDRIENLRARTSVLAIDLACDCHVETFPWQGKYLVVDVKPGPDPDLASVAVSPAASPFPIINDARSTDDGLPRGSTALLGVLDREIATNSAAQLIEGDLARSIARAATQGLLEPSGIPSSESSVQPAIESSSETSLDVDQMVDLAEPAGTSNLADLMPHFGIQTQTVIDRDGLKSSGGPGVLNQDPGCLPATLFDMTDWIDDRPFGSQIAEKLSRLTGELDKIPPGAAEDLARTYTAFGFGREAIQALAIDLSNSQERRVLTSMAAIIDEMTLPFPDVASQSACPTPAALWAVLANDPVDKARLIDKNAVLQAFQLLPDGLQRQLGPRLADRMLALDDPESANTLLNRLSVETKDPTVERGLSEAAIAGHIDGSTAEIDALTDLANGNARMSPEALVDLLRLARSENKPVDESIITLAAAIRFENRNQPVLNDLVAAEVGLLSDHKLYQQVFDLLSEERDRLASDVLMALTSETLLDMSAHADDVDFLEVTLGDLPESFSPDAQNSVAARLIDLGFADRAAALLIGPANGQAAAERRYIRARAAVELGNPDDAIRLLAGLSDPRAAEIRVQARTLEGDLAAAFAATNALPGTPQEAEAAWRTGSWAALARSEDPVLQKAGAIMAQTAPLPDPALPTAPSLALGNSALNEAQSSRDFIADLLDRYQPPDS